MNSYQHFMDIFGYINGYGVGHAKLLEPLMTMREYPAQWKKPTLDLDELARLSLDEGWTSKQLQAHFGCSRSKVNLERRKLKKLHRFAFGAVEEKHNCEENELIHLSLSFLKTYQIPSAAFLQTLMFL
jgi:hypothetical protein